MPAGSRFDLSGRVALVTGASRGIGSAIAEALAEHGAQVVLSSRKQADLDTEAERINALYAERATAVAAHAGRPEDLGRLVQAVMERFSRIDILVNNAATNPYFGALLDVPDSAWDKTFEVNPRGYFYFAREVIKHLQSRKAPGSIVNVASMVALRAAPMQGVYAMSKAAVVSMTQTLAFEVGGQGIRVNAIAPGLVETKFASAIVQNDAMRNMVVGRTPLGRHAQPVEIAGAALYLASDASSFVNGHTLVVDGGLTIT